MLAEWEALVVLCKAVGVGDPLATAGVLFCAWKTWQVERRTRGFRERLETLEARRARLEAA